MLLGVTGTLGSGKDTMSEYLKNKEFFHYSFADAVRDECDRRGLPKDRETLQKVGNELRASFGPDVLAKRAVDAVKRNNAQSAVLTSIRNPVEVEFLKNQPGFVLISVDAPIKTRYERILARKRDSDFVDFKTFKAQEGKEMSGAAHEQDLKTVIAAADYQIANDGTIEQFHEKIDEVLNRIEGKLSTDSESSSE